MEKNRPKVAVISDVHLGSYGCHAQELHNYLKSIKPEILILNGDFIDIWQFRKNYWPVAHMQVINRILKLAVQGTKVYYITGNHDDSLRKYVDLEIGGITLCNQLVTEINGESYWFFHGDVLDLSIQQSKWLAKLGGKGYDLLILLNRVINKFLEYIGSKKIPLSAKVKESVKQAVKVISDFEKTSAAIAIDMKYDYVVCGHIHKPVIKEYWNDKGMVNYMNSGDWVENLSCLEFDGKKWNIVNYSEEVHKPVHEVETPLTYSSFKWPPFPSVA